MRRKKTCWLAGSLLIIFAVGCNSKPAKGPAETVPVSAATTVKREMPVELTAIGIVEPVSSVAIVAQVSGILQSVHFSEGKEVNKGDLLFTIDVAPYQAMLQQAQANLAKVKAEAANAQSELARYQGLVGKDYITKDQFDQAKADSLSLEAAVKAAEAAAANAKLQVDYTTIRSPIDGRTGDLLVKAGNLIKANELATPLVKINQLKPVLVRFSLPEADLPRVREAGQAGRLKVAVHPGGKGEKTIEGALSFLDNNVDRATGTILLKGLFENKDEELWPGQYVETDLILRTEPQALVIPSEAVQTGQTGQYVWVIRPDKSVETRKIVIDFTVGQETVVRDGLKEHEQVVVDGQIRLGAQSKVQIKNAEGVK